MESTEHKEKESLVEEIGLYFEKKYKMSPLTSRIYTLLILCSNEGYTFDEIVEFTNSSKSSVSNSLNLLTETGGAEYYTKPGERKRYFRSTRNYLKLTLIKQSEEALKDLHVARHINDFNSHYNKRKHDRYKNFGKLYEQFLEKYIESIELTIDKMNQLEKE
ncbi:MAG: hypothetical protein M9887_12535 [Chitinophagales bacterium]|nr:hypothetical protein [Chitinophagales bacterium]